MQVYPGNEAVKRGLEIAAVGNLGVLMIGQWEMMEYSLLYASMVHEKANGRVERYDVMNINKMVEYVGACPCGYYRDYVVPCDCEPKDIQNHYIDVKKSMSDYQVIVRVERVEAAKMLNDTSEPIEIVLDRIREAKKYLNDVVDKLDEESKELLSMAVRERGYFPVNVRNIKLTARCCAALVGRKEIKVQDVAEAIVFQDTKFF